MYMHRVYKNLSKPFVAQPFYASFQFDTKPHTKGERIELVIEVPFFKHEFQPCDHPLFYDKKMIFIAKYRFQERLFE